MSNVSKCFLCARKNDYDPKFGYYGCKLSGQECKGYSMFEPKVKPKPKTNADRIRAMSDEELAETFDLLTRTRPDTKDDKQSWLDWLRQEAKDAESV